MFKFEYRLNDEDYLLFNQYYLENTVAGNVILLEHKFVVPFACIMFVVMSNIIIQYPLSILINIAVLLSIVSVIWIIFSKRMVLLSLKNNIQKTQAKGRLPYAPEGLLIFEDEQIQEITPGSEMKKKYSLVEEVRITERAIYIYYGPTLGHIIFTSVFSSEEEKQKFLQFINSKI